MLANEGGTNDNRVTYSDENISHILYVHHTIYDKLILNKEKLILLHDGFPTKAIEFDLMWVYFLT